VVGARATKRARLGSALVCLCASWAPLAAADIFIAYDEDGGAVFTDRPPYAGAIPFIRSAVVPATGSAGVQPVRESEAQLASIGVQADPPPSASEPQAMPREPGDTRLANVNKSFRDAD
jgi:hypothetical protein